MPAGHAAPTTVARLLWSALAEATRSYTETVNREGYESLDEVEKTGRHGGAYRGWRLEGRSASVIVLYDSPEMERMIETLWMRRKSVALGAREKHKRIKEGTRTHYAPYGRAIGQMAGWRVGRTHSWIDLKTALVVHERAFRLNCP